MLCPLSTVLYTVVRNYRGSPTARATEHVYMCISTAGGSRGIPGGPFVCGVRCTTRCLRGKDERPRLVAEAEGARAVRESEGVARGNELGNTLPDIEKLRRCGVKQLLRVERMGHGDVAVAGVDVALHVRQR
uniref:Uncharacterized protein n=1 Tax=Haptolina ericina TaxID=156174 RepID=A0A7S3EYM5_9EUKA|mmetsp:Transcript_3717/g.8092  ORF Transcript_3717/g.8092 Transcript_3717/m.8092 type:complete len:132 (+) Transcript_3717:97-492(+)